MPPHLSVRCQSIWVQGRLKLIGGLDHLVDNIMRDFAMFRAPCFKSLLADIPKKLAEIRYYSLSAVPISLTTKPATWRKHYGYR